MEDFHQVPFAIDELTPNDSGALLGLVDALNWTFTHADFQTAFAAGRFFGHRRGSEVLSCIAVFNYGENLASIGAVMVHPDDQRKGLGQALMDHVHALPEMQGRQIVLVSTEEGKPLYGAMGYRTITHLNKMVAPVAIAAQRVDTTPVGLRKIAQNDVEAIIGLDASAVGQPRSSLLRARLRQSHCGLVATGSNGSICGFALGVDQRGQLICGPLVASDDVTAFALITTLAQHHRGTVRADIPDGKQSFVELLASNGFQRETHPPLMVRHPEKSFRHGSNFYAPMAQMFG